MFSFQANQAGTTPLVVDSVKITAKEGSSGAVTVGGVYRIVDEFEFKAEEQVWQCALLWLT